MMNMKKLLALLLAIVMVVGMFPMTAMAEGEEPTCATCGSTEHTEHPADPAPQNLDETPDQTPADNCENCDNPECTGCDGADSQNEEEEDKDPEVPVCTGDKTTCPIENCECKKESEPVCTGDKTTCLIENCECKKESEPVCTGDKTTCPIENCECKKKSEPVCTGDKNTCPIENCTCKQEPAILCDKCKATETNEDGTVKHAETCETLKPAVLCEKCGATEKNEDGTVKHTETCETLCTCTPIDGVHQGECIFAPVIEAEACKTCGKQECECPKVGDKIWIKSGSRVYKNYNNVDKNYHELIGNYEVEIKHILTNDEGAVEWYEFKFTKLGLGEAILLTGGYKYVHVENTSVEEPEEERETITTVELDDGTVVTADGIPEGMQLVVTEVSSEKREIGASLASMEMGYTPPRTRGGSAYFCNTYNISVEDQGEDWQPEAGESVKVVIDLGIGWLNYRTYLTVIHVLDTVDAINSADNKYLHFGTDLNDLYPEASAAAEAAGYPENCVVYTVMSPETGEVSYDTSGKIILNTTSFSDYTIMAFNVDNSVYMSNIPDNGVVLNKKASFDNETGKGTITLESYVKGSAESTPTDVVLVIDHSGSMWSAVDPANGQMAYSELVSEKGKREGYYVAFKKDAKSGAYLIRYYNGEWQISRSVASTNYETNGAFKGFINTTWGSNRGWTNLTNTDAYIYCISISGALYDALNVFMTEMEKAVNCRVSIVTFSGDTKELEWSTQTSENSYRGSGIFIDGTLNWDNTQPSLTKQQYANAFEDPTTADGKAQLKKAINAINTDYGSTPTAMGLLYARRMFLQAGRGNSNKVVVVFTDGRPSPEYLFNRGSDSCSCNSQNSIEGCPYHTSARKEITTDNFVTHEFVSTYIDQANQLKNGNKATVYSIGPTSGNAGLDVLRNIATSNNHVFSAEADKLSKVFHDIAGFIVSSSQSLNKDTATVDDIVPSFQIPAAVTEEDIKVYTSNHKGSYQFDDANKVELTSAVVDFSEDRKTVSVSGFKYDEHAVTMSGTQPVGQKLIIEIPYEPIDGFLGGDGVITNEGTSGIYNGNALIELYNQPDVDVDLQEIAPNPVTKDIYISQQAELPTIVNIGNYLIGTTNHTIDGIKNGYVNIKYTVKDKTTGNKMTFVIPAGTTTDGLAGQYWDETDGLVTHPVLEADTTYEVTCEVISKNKTSHTATGKPVNKTVHVYKPEITFKDSAINLGEKANYETQNVVNPVVWRHTAADGTVTNADPVTMGAAPTLEYRYDPGEAAFTDLRTPVKVEVTSKTDGKTVPADMPITEFVTFWREACEFPNCENTSKTSVSASDPNRVNFVVHLKSFDLTITKEVSAAELAKDPGTSFMFRVYKGTDDNKEFVTDVVINGSGSVTIKNLPAGVYTVTELTDWSWRYEVVDGATKIANAAKAQNGVTTVTFKNQRENIYWVDGETSAKNIFTAVSSN